MRERMATSASVEKGQISKANIKKLAAIMTGDPKVINWNVVRSIVMTYHPNKKGAQNLDQILTTTLGRACRDESSSSTLKLVLQKLNDLSLSDRVTFAHRAARCSNMEHLKAIVYDDPSVLFHNPRDSMPLLHMVCELHDGWSKEVQFLLETILENRNREGKQSWSGHEGLFEEAGEDMKMPLDILIEAGSDLVEIVDYLRDHYPDYLKANLIRVCSVIAWDMNDMDLLIECITWSEDALLFSSHPRQGSSVLGLACHHQNDSMVFALCQRYFEHYNLNFNGSFNTHDSLIHLQNHLIAPNKNGLSPLGDLLLSVSNPDAGFAWACVTQIVRFFDQFNEYEEGEERKGFRFHILHLFLSNTWDKILDLQNCIKTLNRIIDRLEIDLCSVQEETGQTLLSIIIENIAANDTKSKRELSLEILDYFIDPNAAAAPRPPATIRTGYGRLPLHIACEHSLLWKGGLETILNANMPALESVDGITGLPPFAHCAVGAKSDLNSIYELLRLRPDSIDRYCS